MYPNYANAASLELAKQICQLSIILTQFLIPKVAIGLVSTFLSQTQRHYDSQK